MSANTYTVGTPVDFVQATVLDLVYLLDAGNGHTYEVVQFCNAGSGAGGSGSNIATYNKQGGVPNQLGIGASNGFKAGYGEQIIFTKEELKAGVNIINSVNLSAVYINVQYYKN